MSYVHDDPGDLSDAPASLDVRYSASSQIPSLVVMSLFAVALAIVGALDVIPTWLAATGVVALLSVIILGLYGLQLSRKPTTVLRLDTNGVTVTGAPFIPWTHLREVLITPPAEMGLRRTPAQLRYEPDDGAGHHVEHGRRNRCCR